MRLWVGSEVVFAVAFAAMALLVAYSPDVWGTEKPMDMAFITASNASDSFPPHDPWMSGEDLNYYYLGHLAMAIVIKVVGTAPDEGYNLAFALLAALSATAVFTLAGTLWAAARPRLTGVRGGPVLVGVTAVVICLVLGNLAGAREWLDAADPPGDYDWFAPSRVIPGTINEFPWFSFLLGDLHAHVLALPFTVVALGFALQVALAGPRGDAVLRGVAEALAAGLAVGVLYAINSWSYPVTAGLLAAAVVVWLLDPRSAGRRGYAITWLVLVLVASVVLVLPFWLNFNPAASGIALVDERRPFARFMGDMALLYGIFAGLLAAAFAARLLATRRPARALVWGLVAAIFAGSLLAAADLAGVAVLALLLGVAIGAALSPGLAAPERFLWLLVSGGLALVIAPELVYVRDAFDGSDLFRMNTVFKLGYQAWLLLALAAACALPWASAHLPRRAWPLWAAGAAVLVLFGLVYPYAGTYARKEGFARSPSLDGLGVAAADGAGRSARHRLAARQHARQRGRARGGGRRLLGLRPRPHVDLQRPRDRARLARPRAAVGPPAGRPGRGRAHALHDRRPRRGAPDHRPLRGRLRRLRPDRAHDLRRRRARQVGRARRGASSSATARRSGGSG